MDSVTVTVRRKLWLRVLQAAIFRLLYWLARLGFIGPNVALSVAENVVRYGLVVTVQ